MNDEYVMWSRKHENYELHGSNSMLENLVTDFQHPIYENQEFRNQKFDLVRLPNSVEFNPWIEFD